MAVNASTIRARLFAAAPRVHGRPNSRERKKPEAEITQPTAARRCAEGVLKQRPDPVVRYRLLRDVLGVERDNPGILEARRNALDSRWVRELREEQRDDGGWGCCYTASSSLDPRIPTTESAVCRALALGLDGRDPMLGNTAGYLEAILEGTAAIPDPPERSERWPVGERVFTAGTLALIRPESRWLDREWDLWAEIAGRSSPDGVHDADAELSAHSDLTGVSGDLRRLDLRNRYALAILGSRADALSERVERALTSWVWQSGVRHLEAPLAPVSRIAGRMLDRWFATHEMMARFPSWRRLARPVVEWLWAQQGGDGLWDFGPVARQSSVYWPLSEDWYSPIKCRHDYTVRVLALLKALSGYGGGGTE